MLRKKLTFLVSALMLSACAVNKSTYEWGSYQQAVYQHFDQSTSPEEQLEKLEADLSKAQGTDRAIAPGFHAHLGMLYHIVGNAAKGTSHFEQEKILYPESSTFINFLLSKKTAIQQAMPKGESKTKNATGGVQALHKTQTQRSASSSKTKD